MHLDAPFICFVCVFVCRKLSHHLSLGAGSQVFALLMFFSLCDVSYYVVGKSLHLLCSLPFGFLCVSAISMMLAVDIVI